MNYSVISDHVWNPQRQIFDSTIGTNKICSDTQQQFQYFKTGPRPTTSLGERRSAYLNIKSGCSTSLKLSHKCPEYLISHSPNAASISKLSVQQYRRARLMSSSRRYQSAKLHSKLVYANVISINTRKLLTTILIQLRLHGPSLLGTDYTIQKHI